jgi:hypothetical protein
VKRVSLYIILPEKLAHKINRVNENIKKIITLKCPDSLNIGAIKLNGNKLNSLEIEVEKISKKNK